LAQEGGGGDGGAGGGGTKAASPSPVFLKNMRGDLLPSSPGKGKGLSGKRKHAQRQLGGKKRAKYWIVTDGSGIQCYWGRQNRKKVAASMERGTTQKKLLELGKTKKRTVVGKLFFFETLKVFKGNQPKVTGFLGPKGMGMVKKKIGGGGGGRQVFNGCVCLVLRVLFFGFFGRGGGKKNFRCSGSERTG